MTFATTPAAELEAAKQALVASSKATTQAAAALAVHEAEHGDLAARGVRLRQEQHHLDQQRVKSADRADALVLVDLGSKLAAVQARMDQRRRDAFSQWSEAETISDGRTLDRGAGLVDTGFPAGTFEAVDTPVGSRSAWRDHVLAAIARQYPDVVVEVLGSEGSAVVARIQADDAAKKPRWYAVGCPSWNVYPGRKLGS